MANQFSQPDKILNVQGNKQAIARVFGVKTNEVIYLTVGVNLSGYLLAYEKTTQKTYWLGVTTGVVVSWSVINGILTLVTTTGSVELTEAIATTSLGVATINVPADYETLNDALYAIADKRIKTPLSILISPGNYNSETILINHPDAENITISGEQVPESITISGGSLTSGVSGNYLYTFNVPTEHGVISGDIVGVRDTLGTGGASALQGAFKVVSVTTNTITVRMRMYADSFPTISLTSAVMWVFTTVFNFTGIDGVVVRGSSLGMLSNIAICGNMTDYWNTADIATTEKGTHGIYISANTIISGSATPGGKNPNAIAGGSISMQWVAVLDFDQQGICPANGASAFCRYTFVSSCGRRGFYVGNAASIDARQCLSTQNYLDGVIADYNGAFNTSGFWASGNRLDGMLAINGGSLIAPNITAENNQQFGIEVRAGSYASIDASSIQYNISGGCHTEYNASLSMLNAIVSNNLIDGLQAYYGCSIRATGATLSGNARYNINCLNSDIVCTLTNITGAGTADFNNQGGDIFTGSAWIPSTPVTPEYTVNITNTAGTHTASLVQTSTGALVFTVDTASLLTLQSNTMYPNVDGAMTFGRDANRCSAVYTRQLIFGTTGLQSITAGTGSPEGAYTAPVGSIRINLNGGAGATLYVKESGSGNTGWVAK